MGLFGDCWGALKRGAARVWSGVKTVAKKTVEAVKEVATVAWEGVKKGGAMIKSGWEKYTGRDKEREAEELLAQLETKARTAEQEYQTFAEKIQDRINNALDRLNNMRDELNEHDFRRFEKLASLFSNWEVSKVRAELAAELPMHHLESLKGRNDLFKIDFRNHPIKSNLKAVFTLGFLTRKRAKETLLAVREEEHRLDLDLERLNTEKKRLSLIADSLEQITSQITKFHQTYYQKLLNELDYSVNLLRSCYYIQTSEAVPDKLDVEMMPFRHQQCLECVDKATRILYAIGNYSFVTWTKSSLQKNDDDFDNYKKQQLLLDELQQSFAA